MINKKPIPSFAALKNLFIFPVAAILLMTFSFSPAPTNAVNSFQEPIFSQGSNVKILKFLAENITYPKGAKNLTDTGKIYVVVKMGKGGIVEECKALTDSKGISVPILQMVVVVGYIPTASDHPLAGNNKDALKAECLRVAQKLGSCDVPEWKDKNLEFAVPVKFVLH